MKIVITGGHLSPALALIQKLRNEEIFYIGRKHTFEGDAALSLEYLEISKLDISFYPIKTARLQRQLSKHTIPSLLKFPVGFYQSLKILRKVKPDVVVGFGGYVSIPVIFAASLLKIPIVIHEQTLGAGFANKLVKNLADKICISWKSSAKFFPAEKTVLTGNPVREEIVRVKGKTSKSGELPQIYVTGGSSGAHFINQLIERNLLSLLNKYKILHQTGDSKEFKDYDNLVAIKSSLKSAMSANYEVKKFLDATESAEALLSSSLVVGRSGINTVTELIFLEKPALLIPLPFAQANEQLLNAELLKKAGLGEFIKQKELTDEMFISKLSGMFENIGGYSLRENILKENSLDELVKVVYDVSKKKNT